MTRSVNNYERHWRVVLQRAFNLPLYIINTVPLNNLNGKNSSPFVEANDSPKNILK